MKSGFTLIEVVVALVVTVLIWGAVASALATVARMDAAAERFHEAALLARRLSARDGRGDEPEADSAPEGWRVERLTEKDADGRAWRGWRIQSLDRSIFDERIFTLPNCPSVPDEAVGGGKETAWM